MLASAREVVAAYCAINGRGALRAEWAVITATCFIASIAGCVFVLLEPVG